MKLKLLSDFHDFYDHQFDSKGQVFRRVSTDGMCRAKALKFLNDIGIKTPRHGSVYSMFCEPKFAWPDKVVVYDDPIKHQGQGKTLMKFAKAVAWHPNSYCSEYLYSDSYSLRQLQIGEYEIWLSYQSDDTWRSNCGEDIKIAVVGCEKKGYHPKIHTPLWAIDYVNGYAIDFNVAPGLRATGIQEFLTPAKLVNELRSAVEYYEGF